MKNIHIRKIGDLSNQSLQPSVLRAISRKAGQYSLIISLVNVAYSIRADEVGPIVVDPKMLEDVVVEERSDSLIGIGDSATQGTVGPDQLKLRPILRPGEILETVPGLIITQHSGSGKANQYFLRGFNLDHGTDFATRVAGVPINFPTHGHGQGYTDLNFLIPELVSGIQYVKGPYYAEWGDFSSAGAVDIDYADELDQAIISFTGGNYDYFRGLLAGSTQVGAGHMLGALEIVDNDGPWGNPNEYRRYNGVLRYSQGDKLNGVNFTAMGYGSNWFATDQVPRRAVNQRKISRFDPIDPTDGGDTYRFNLAGEYRKTTDNTATHIHAYFSDYSFNLHSNFTYFLDDPVNGDQFEQEDKRQVYGLNAHNTWFGEIYGLEMENTLGFQVRYDDIGSVGLFHTKQRKRIGTFRQDSVDEVSLSPYFQNRIQWHPKFRTIFGLRGDYYHFDVNSNIAANSGSASDGLASPKLSLIFGPWYDTEIYTNLGYGFHSNDGRGTTITVDPKTGDPADKVDPLVRTKGVDVGLRTEYIPGLNSTLSLWLLDIDSELLFVGDAGATEASRPSRRYGLEFTNYYRILSWLILDADFSFSKARFRDDDPAGDRIPGSVETVIAAGLTVDNLDGWFGSIRVRHFGARPLIEDNSVRSNPTTLVNAGVGYEFDKTWRLSFDVLNLLDVENDDISYYYASRLPGERANGVDDVHFHPVEPFSFRATVTARF